MFPVTEAEFGAAFRTGHTSAGSELAPSCKEKQINSVFHTNSDQHSPTNGAELTVRYELSTPWGTGQGSGTPLQIPLYRHQPQAPSVSRQSTQLRHKQEANMTKTTDTIVGNSPFSCTAVEYCQSIFIGSKRYTNFNTHKTKISCCRKKYHIDHFTEWGLI